MRYWVEYRPPPKFAVMVYVVLPVSVVGAVNWPSDWESSPPGDGRVPVEAGALVVKVTPV